MEFIFLYGRVLSRYARHAISVSMVASWLMFYFEIKDRQSFDPTCYLSLGLLEILDPL